MEDFAFFSPHVLQAATGQDECVEGLLQRGASVCVKDIRGRTPLHLASACGHVGVLGTLLQTTPPSLTHLTDSQGYTPLHWACYNGTGIQHAWVSVLRELPTEHLCSAVPTVLQVTMHVWRFC